MSGLNLYASNHLEILAKKLAGVLSKPLPSPLQKEIIVVQSKGMERWVSMEIARHHGIFANCWFPYPIHFAYSLFREIIPDIPEESPFGPAVMTWKVMGLLPSCLDNKAFESLRIYLEGGQSKLKRFQLAERKAYLFDQYLLFRPEMILGWETGQEDHWQAILWRELVKTEEEKHVIVQYPLTLYGRVPNPPLPLPQGEGELIGDRRCLLPPGDDLYPHLTPWV